MSWGSFCTSLTSGGSVSYGAIVGVDGGIWAQSDGMGLSAVEAKSIAGGFGSPDTLRSKGVVVNGVKYMFLRSTEDTIISKKGSSGCVAVLAKKCFVVGVYSDMGSPAAANAAVSKMADYLRDSGY